MSLKDDPELGPRANWKRLGLGAALGALGGMVGVFAARGLNLDDMKLRWSDELAGLIALALLALGVFMLVGVVIERLGLLLMRSDQPRLSAALKRQLGLQSLTLILAGGMLGAVPLLSGGLSDSDKVLFFAGITGVFILQTVINLLIWRTADEFYRRMMVETAAVAFWVLQSALFLWAVAERMGLAPALQSWDAVAVLMAVYLLLSCLVAWRLGLE